MREGWLGTYWAQGMEEPEWLIFQDRRFTTGRPGGWLLEGMHRLQAGDRLEILGPQGERLWQGELRARRQGWFGNLTPSQPEWHPEEVSLEIWQGWFRRDPPLEAHLWPAD